MERKEEGAVKTLKQNFKNAAIILFGCALYAFALDVFLLPREIVVGGVSGIATVLYVLFGLPVGAMIFLINIPLLWASAVRFGKSFVLRTLIGVALTSVLTDLFVFLPKSESDPFVCALLGGACLGGGVGIVLHYGITTGGTDVAAHLIKLRAARYSIGRLIFIIDAVIILLCAIALGSYDGILYSFVACTATAYTLDAAAKGMKRSSMLIVITDAAEELCKTLSADVGRGVTLLDCTGWYSQKKKQVVICVVKHRELYFAKQKIRAADRGAFIITADAEDVNGLGFDETSE